MYKFKLITFWNNYRFIMLCFITWIFTYAFWKCFLFYILKLAVYSLQTDETWTQPADNWALLHYHHCHPEGPLQDAEALPSNLFLIAVAFLSYISTIIYLISHFELCIGLLSRIEYLKILCSLWFYLAFILVFIYNFCLNQLRSKVHASQSPGGPRGLLACFDQIKKPTLKGFLNHHPWLCANNK